MFGKIHVNNIDLSIKIDKGAYFTQTDLMNLGKMDTIILVFAQKFHTQLKKIGYSTKIDDVLLRS